MGATLALAVLAMAGEVSAGKPESSPDAAEPAAAGFGKRAGFLLALDNALGVSVDQLGKGGSDSARFMGGFPGLFGPRIGMHGATSSGVTAGANLGMGFAIADGGGSLVRVSVAPRVGYAGSATPTFGYWLRGGPSLHFLAADRGEGAALVGLGLEAFAVVTPVDHLGVMFGPTAELGLTGTRDAKYTSYGFSVGLVGDL